MHHNQAYHDGDFDDYQRYLETIKSRLTPELYAFVSDPKRHDLSKDSLHDALITAFTVESPAHDEPRARLVLLGAYHDREFVLDFLGVIRYQTAQWVSFDMQVDLLTFEIGFKETDEGERLYFLAELAGDDTIEIWCRDIKIVERFLAK